MADDAQDLADLTASVRAYVGRAARAGQLARPSLSLPEPEPEPQPEPRSQPVSSGSGLTLAQVRADLGDCTRCKLHTGRQNIVFGDGSPTAALMFVGEGPGANEDAQGVPFVGEAGQLLDKMIVAMGWRRQDVYIANIVKCRPPGNRNPEADEIASCEPFLDGQLTAIRPRVLVALGKFAAQYLCGKPEASISALRGQFHSHRGIPVMPTFHPAYLLRTPSAKRDVWADLQLVMARLEELGVRPPTA